MGKQVTAELVQVLVDAGAAVNAVDSMGRTPLYFAMLNAKSTTVLKYLVKEAGAHVNLLDEKMQSPLDFAIVGSKLLNVRYLLQLGAKLTMKQRNRYQDSLFTMLLERCYVCAKAKGSFYCPDCKGRYYCSKKCQTADADTHQDCKQ
jgi:ankyrin repeat protein